MCVCVCVYESYQHSYIHDNCKAVATTSIHLVVGRFHILRYFGPNDEVVY